MLINTRSRIVLLFAALGLSAVAATAQQRKWTDSTGKHSVEAEFVEVKDGNAVLKRASGKTVAVPLARLSTADRKYISEQAAVAAIEQFGGAVKRALPRNTVRGVRLNGPQVTDSVFESIKVLSDVEWIDLSYSSITDTGLQHLSNLPRLGQLELAECQITDAGLEHIRGLKSLTFVSLNGTQVTDAGLKGLMELKGLSQLRLNGTQITDAGLTSIADLKRLSMLFLSRTEVTDATLERLQQLNNLGLLELSDTRITDDGLIHLQVLKRLSFLILSNTQVTDAGLQHLRALPELAFLSLSNTQVTDSGIPHLNGLPKLRFVRLVNTQVTDAGVKPLERLGPLGGSVELVTRPKSDEDMAWRSQLAELTFLTIVHSSDTGEKEFVHSLLLRAHSLEPANSTWGRILGDWHEAAARPIPQRGPHGQSNVEQLRKALEYFEEAYPKIEDADQKNYTLLKMTRLSFDALDYAKAKKYATQLLAQSEIRPPQGDGKPEGEAIHHGNLILGRVALREGDVSQAKSRLLEAGRTSGSPSLDSFGPNMALAKELLETGEKEVILEYFELCKKFWNRQTLDKWADEIKNEKVPDFGANLDY